MRTKLNLMITILIIMSSLACSITPRLSVPKETTASPTGSFKTMEINEAPSSADQVNINLIMGSGQLKLSSGTDQFVEGTIEYSEDEFAPVINRGLASLTIEQKITWDKLKLIRQNTINRWNLKLSPKPSNLDIQAGAYEGTFELGGLALSNLKINEGASKTIVSFSEPNQAEMDTLTFNTGASTVEMKQLGNANFSNMDFTSGAGNYILDFSGELKQNASVRINSGISQLKIIIPEGTKAIIHIEDSANHAVTTGNWNVSDNTYQTEGDSFTLTISIKMGLGGITLEHAGK